MTTSRTNWMKLLSMMLVVLLLLDAVNARSIKKAKKKSRSRPKHCGAKGHPCEPGSRKLCCAEGYTCKVIKTVINLTKHQEKITKIGVCRPVPPAGSGEREVEEHRPTVKVKTPSETPHPSQSLRLWGQLVCDNLDLVLERFIDHLDEPQGMIWKAGHIGHGKGSVVWLETCLGKNNNLDKCLNYKWNIPGVVDLYRHYLCFRNYIYNF